MRLVGFGFGYAVALFLVMSTARAGSLQVESRHERLSLQEGQAKQEYLWLKPDEMLALRIKGPTDLGLRFREIMVKEEGVKPVYLTVVRDDQEQGTVRFSLPQSGNIRLVQLKDLECSGEVLVKIEIPAGWHGYRLLVSGPPRGALVQLLPALREKEKFILATPGRSQQTSTIQAGRQKATSPPSVPRVEKAPAPLVAEPMEILAPVVAASPKNESVILSQTVSRRRPSQFGPGTRIASSTAAVFLVGTISLVISGAAIEEQARDEPIQISAGRLYHRAERTYQASGVMASLSAAAIVAALICYLVEQSEYGFEPNQLGLGIRF